jgi:hypothetical protein
MQSSEIQCLLVLLVLVIGIVLVLQVLRLIQEHGNALLSKTLDSMSCSNVLMPTSYYVCNNDNFTSRRRPLNSSGAYFDWYSSPSNYLSYARKLRHTNS